MWDAEGSKYAIPRFYISTRSGKAWTFTGATSLPIVYKSTPNVVSLPEQVTPYVSQGSGSGRLISLNAQLSAWHKFVASASTGVTAAREPGASVLDEVYEIEDYINEYGPSPLVFLHRLKRPVMTVALTDFSYDVNLMEDNATTNQEPTTIPISMNYIEVSPYRVKVSR